MTAFVRSEEDIIAKAAVVVKLGTKEYNIKPLTILKQRDWRTKFNAEMATVMSNFNPAADRDTVVSGLTGALLEFPEKLTELVFAYAPELPQDEILAEATEEQIARAFSVIMNLAFPFVAQLKLVRQINKAQLSPSQA